MFLKYGYSYEKLSHAIDILATGKENIQDRVRDAYLADLAHVKEEELPNGALPVFREIKEKLTKVSSLHGKEGIIKTTTDAIGPERASEIAKKIVELFHRVAEKYYEETRDL